MSEFQKKIGILIRDHRIKKNWTQLEVSERLGFQSPQFISIIERGLSPVPLKVLGQLIVLLNMPEKQIIKELLKEYENELIAGFKKGKSKVTSSGS